MLTAMAIIYSSNRLQLHPPAVGVHDLPLFCVLLALYSRERSQTQEYLLRFRLLFM
jgi:hypothetical protein